MKISGLHLLVTFLSHFFILVSLGHGGGFLGLISFFYAFSLEVKADLSAIISFRSDTFSALCFLGLTGYLLLGIAWFVVLQWRNGLYVAALIFLYSGLVYLWIPRKGFETIYTHPVFSLPFVIVSTLPFYQNKLLMLWRKFDT